MARTGRPTKLTPQVHKEIVELVEAGNYIEVAAACVGIDRATVFRWLKRGARKQGGIYGIFARAVRKAQAKSEVLDLVTIAVAAKKHWQAAAWRLERKHPERYGFRGIVRAQGDAPPEPGSDRPPTPGELAKRARTPAVASAAAVFFRALAGEEDLPEPSTTQDGPGSVPSTTHADERSDEGSVDPEPGEEPPEEG